MKKPTMEEQELLVDLLFNSDAMHVVMDEMERQVISLEQDLVRSSLLDSVDDERKCIRLKLEAQGARKLFTAFRSRLEKIRLAASKAEVPKP